MLVRYEMIKCLLSGKMNLWMFLCFSRCPPKSVMIPLMSSQSWGRLRQWQMGEEKMNFWSLSSWKVWHSFFCSRIARRNLLVPIWQIMVHPLILLVNSETAKRQAPTVSGRTDDSEAPLQKILGFLHNRDKTTKNGSYGCLLLSSLLLTYSKTHELFWELLQCRLVQKTFCSPILPGLKLDLEDWICENALATMIHAD